ncbi:MAG: hypothetical protein AAF513_06840 [Pseudomonadota bacterium]
MGVPFDHTHALELVDAGDGVLHHPAIHFDTEPIAFGGREKRSRWYPTVTLSIAQAKQHLQPANLRVLALECVDRLSKERERVFFEALMQALNPAHFPAMLFEPGVTAVDDIHLIASAIFRDVTRSVSLLQRRGRVDLLSGRAHRTYAHADPEHARFPAEHQILYLGAYALGHLGNLLLDPTAQQDSKLITPQTNDKIVFPNTLGEQQRHLFEQLVAGGMARRIIDDLELIQIENPDREAFAPVIPQLAGVHQLAIQNPAVGKPAERIMISLVFEIERARLHLIFQVAISFRDHGQHGVHIIRQHAHFVVMRHLRTQRVVIGFADLACQFRQPPDRGEDVALDPGRKKCRNQQR